MVRVVRFARMPFGTYGKLYVPDCDTQFTTVERPWLVNQPSQSCIPVGLYEFVRGTYRHGTPDTKDDYPCFEIMGVPGRSDVKEHIANRPEEVRGCIGIGLGFGIDRGIWSVTHSKEAQHQFMEAMGAIEKTDIKITWGW